MEKSTTKKAFGLDDFFNILELVVCISFVCFHLYTAGFGMLKATAQKFVHLGLIFLVSISICSAKTKGTRFCRPRTLRRS